MSVDVVGPRRFTVDETAAEGWLLSHPGPSDPRDPSAATGGSSTLVADDGACRALVDGMLYDDRDAVHAGAAAAQRVIEAYRRGGERALEDLNGRFAAVLWDDARGVLVCARDQLGIHPLFWAEVDGGILVSPSMAVLARRPGVSTRLNRVVLAEHLAQRWLDPQETFYEAIRRVPPGHLLRVAGGRREVRRYWHPAARSPEDWVTEDQLEQFGELFARAIDRCLALGRPGIFLSGGLDSVSVAAVARERSALAGLGQPLALSLAFPHPDCDERDVQRGVASGLGLPQIMIGLEEAAGPRGVLGAAVELSGDWPAPLVNYWLPAYMSLAAEGRRAGCGVILTGTGGDEWLGVTPYYAADLIRRGDVAGLYRLWLSLQRSMPYKRRLLILRNLLWRFGARDMAAAAAVRVLSRTAPGTLRRRRERRIAEHTPDWLARDTRLRRELDERAYDAIPVPPVRDLYHRELDFALDHPLVSVEVEETYESGRRNGVSVLQPFWDPDLIRFLVRTPPELLNRGGRSKGLVRETVARSVPGLGFERQRKIVSTSFSAEMLLAAGPALWRELGGAPCLGALGIVDADRLGSEVSRIFEERDLRAVHRLWYVMSLERWTQSHSGSN